MSPYEPDTPPASELVDRLRKMQWPEPSLAARQRCWESVRRELAGEAGAPAETPPAEESLDVAAEAPSRAWLVPGEAAAERGGQRHEFALRGFEGQYRGALGGRVAVARGGMGRLARAW